MDLNRESSPNHIAIIMDGNARWAKLNGKTVYDGHKQGAEVAKKIVNSASQFGVKYLTLYAFSSENWNRPEGEVSDIKLLLKYYLSNGVEELLDNGVKIKFIGDVSAFGEEISQKCAALESQSSGNDKITVNIALNYGGRQEIENAFKSIIDNKEKPTQENIQKYLYTSDIPDPDLLIRTGGEKRISNFLLWQLAYTELFFTETLWPAFTGEDMSSAIENFAERERRFGGR